ncbi:hypothetical protein ADLECEL_05600 [Adlercreutzia equolifaciens subsp. celatus]|uniref:flavodoxin family protein n=1 Tax=Adlercreutzia equolifaciens TaxID=446660 RepID=UPI00194DB6DE|nr:flavodoxin family protein [Adlercreutzia equolifaciens]BCS56675.1 hypothetical protein ADLECEL_05600 [Adlercreutzia equolifaciens subsp. celatus]
MHRVILHGSCRADGRSAALADELFNACIEECPDDGVSIVSVSSTEVGPCIGCDKCRAAADEPIHLFEEGDPLLPQETVAESGALFHHCVIDDDMNEVRKHLDAADELIVVCPVYFASVPAQMKALLDRLQPYYFTDLRTRPKRPAVIHVVGAGGDPHGFEPLIGTVRSALSVAGFAVELVLDWVGKIRADGEITAEAEEYPLPPHRRLRSHGPRLRRRLRGRGSGRYGRGRRGRRGERRGRKDRDRRRGRRLGRLPGCGRFP